MRGKILLSTLLTAMFIMSGCGGKEAVIDETAEKNVTKPTTTDSSGTTVSSGTETSNVAAESGVEPVYFDFDVFTVRQDMVSVIESNSEKMNSGDLKELRIKIEGNCDEWGTDEYNYALGLKRATSVKKAIIAEGIEEDRITVISYGEANPACTEKNRKCWAENRRADFKLRP